MMGSANRCSGRFGFKRRRMPVRRRPYKRPRGAHGARCACEVVERPPLSVSPAYVSRFGDPPCQSGKCTLRNCTLRKCRFLAPTLDADVLQSRANLDSPGVLAGHMCCDLRKYFKRGGGGNRTRLHGFHFGWLDYVSPGHVCFLSFLS
jgi:hypothetical protein